MIWTVIAITILYVTFGGDGLSHLPPNTLLSSPPSLCLILFGLSAVVMLAAGVRTRFRFQRNGAAVLSDALRVVIKTDRVRNGLFAAALALAEPQLVLRALTSPRWYPVITAVALVYFAVKALRKAFKPAVLAILDTEGIAAPEIWLGRMRWNDLEDIRVGQSAPIGRAVKRIKCLALVFREGCSTPQRVAPSNNFDEHLALGTFMLMPSWIGLTFDDAVCGLNGWLERSRATPGVDHTPALPQTDAPG